MKRALLISALLLLCMPGTARAAGPTSTVQDPDDVAGRRLLDIKSVTNQTEDWSSIPFERGMFSVEAYEPIREANFLTRVGEDPFATVRILVRYSESHPGADYIFTLRWEAELGLFWHGKDLVTGEESRGGVFSPTPDTMTLIYEPHTILVEDFDWAVKHVRLNRTTGEIGDVIDRAPDKGFALPGGD